MDHSDYAVGPCRRLTRALEAVAVGSGCHNMSCITTYFMTHELYYRYGIGRLSPSGRVVVLMMGMRRYPRDLGEVSLGRVRYGASCESAFSHFRLIRLFEKRRSVNGESHRTVYLRIHTRLHTPFTHPTATMEHCNRRHRPCVLVRSSARSPVLRSRHSGSISTARHAPRPHRLLLLLTPVPLDRSTPQPCAPPPPTAPEAQISPPPLTLLLVVVRVERLLPVILRARHPGSDGCRPGRCHKPTYCLGQRDQRSAASCS